MKDMVTAQVPHPALSQEERDNLSFPSPLGGRCPERGVCTRGVDEGPGQLLARKEYPMSGATIIRTQTDLHYG